MFTGRGDKGETDTGIGERVNKGSPIIDLEGDLDELNSFVGFARSISRWGDIKSDLEAVQRDLFTVGEHVTLKGRKRIITEDRVKWLEERIAQYKQRVWESNPVCSSGRFTGGCITAHCQNSLQESRERFDKNSFREGD
jgi:ATP:cob(I)alamin adenosyltransferase